MSNGRINLQLPLELKNEILSAEIDANFQFTNVNRVRVAERAGTDIFCVED